MRGLGLAAEILEVLTLLLALAVHGLALGIESLARRLHLIL